MNSTPGRTLKFENLESKQMLTGLVSFDPSTEILRINGTSGDDWFDVRTDGDTLQVYQDVNNGQLSNALETPDADVVFQINKSRVSEIVFAGGAGDDYLYNLTHISTKAFGGTGNDRLDGGFAADKLYGGPGHDRLNGSFGDDHIAGGSGNDSLFGSDGNDKLYGGAGYDYAYGGDGDDRIATHGQDDRVYAGKGNDRVFLGPGNDYAKGGEGNDWIAGHGGDDDIRGEEGNDRIFGGKGENKIGGGEGKDFLVGGDDDDFIDGGDGIDRVYGHGGNDTLSSGLGGLAGGNWSASRADLVSGGAGNDTMTGYGSWNIFFGGEGNDNITGGSFAHNVIYGDAGNDILKGGSKWDIVSGGSGDDFIDGKYGDDLLIPGAGDDSVYGGYGNDTVQFTGAESYFTVYGAFTTKADDGRLLGEGSNRLEGVEDTSMAGKRYRLTSLIREDIYVWSTGAFDHYDYTSISAPAKLMLTPKVSGTYVINLTSSTILSLKNATRVTVQIQSESGSTIANRSLTSFDRNELFFVSLTKGENYKVTVTTDGNRDVRFRLHGFKNGI